MEGHHYLKRDSHELEDGDLDGFGVVRGVGGWDEGDEEWER